MSTYLIVIPYRDGYDDLHAAVAKVECNSLGDAQRERMRICSSIRNAGFVPEDGWCRTIEEIDSVAAIIDGMKANSSYDAEECCDDCGTVLAAEDVDGKRCTSCGAVLPPGKKSGY